MTTAAVQGKQGKGNAFKALRKNAACNERPSFPSKLYDLLEKAENEADLNSVISWLPDGNAFKIHKPDEFIQKILKKHFSTQTQFKSFTRQLYLYGFSKIPSGDRVGAFAHPKFVRHDISSCSLHRRNQSRGDRRFKTIMPDKVPGSSSHEVFRSEEMPPQHERLFGFDLGSLFSKQVNTSFLKVFESRAFLNDSTRACQHVQSSRLLVTCVENILASDLEPRPIEEMTSYANEKKKNTQT